MFTKKDRYIFFLIAFAALFFRMPLYAAGSQWGIDFSHLLSGNIILACGILFFLGIGLNLTPCVYPLLPVTVGYFGSRRESNFSIRFINGVLFFLGLIIFYTALGLLAGYTGMIFGTFFQHSAVQVGMALLMLLLAASMFKFINLSSFCSLGGLPQKIGDRLGSFGLGLTMGLVAAPCVGPPVVALITFVADSGDIIRGSMYFFFLAAGLGLPYLFLAVYSPLLSLLPGSGRWLGWTEELFGFVLLGLALYFLSPLLGVLTYNLLLGLLLLLAALGLSIRHRPDRNLYFVLRAMIVFLLSAVLLFVFFQPSVEMDEFDWISAEKYLTSSPHVRPTLIYIRADWCLPCRQMERNVYAREDVRDELSRLKTVKIDLTDQPGPRLEKWLIEKDVRGVPTFIFMDCEGSEIKNLRSTGYQPALRLLEKVSRAADSCSS
jgi:thiol:disulfide interchange protein DsbD